MKIRTFAAFLPVLVSLNAVAQEIEKPASKDISITVYNNNLALIKDVRPAHFIKGENLIAFEGVATSIKPESVMILGKDIRVLEQNYDYALLTPSNIIEKSVGQNIKTVRFNQKTGKNVFENAELVAYQAGQPILRFDYGIETNFDGRLVFENLPQKLNQKPTLAAKIASLQEGLEDITLAYLSTGISWKTNYVAGINDEKTLDLTGWVSITNNSGAAYENAAVQLIAGDVEQVYDAPMMARGVMMAKSMSVNMLSDSAFEASSVMPEAFSAYQLYTLPHRTNIEDNQTKQMALIEEQGVLYQKEGRLSSPLYFSNSYAAHFEKLHPALYYIIQNDPESNLGLPLPSGIMRFYENDSKGNLQFIGENKIAQTPKGEKLELEIGKMFDVVIDGKVSNIRKINEAVITAKTDKCPRYKIVKAYDASVDLRNGGEKDVSVVFKQPIGPQTKVVKESMKGAFSDKNANMYEWQIDLEKDSKKALTFTVEVTTEELKCN